MKSTRCCKINYAENISLSSKCTKNSISGYTLEFGEFEGKSSISTFFVQSADDMKYFFNTFMHTGIKKEWGESITLQLFVPISQCFGLEYSSNMINLLKMKNQETSNPTWPLAYRVPLINGFIEIYEDTTYRMFEDEE